MTTKTIDEWCAEQCGIDFPAELSEYKSDMLTYIDGVVVMWTIQDPRCREIVREHFKIDTKEYYGGGWMCVAEGIYPPQRETIAEAEIACITAIYEASQ